MRHAIVVTGGGAGSGNSQSIVKGPLPGLVGARAGPDVPAARHRLPGVLRVGEPVEPGAELVLPVVDELVGEDAVPLDLGHGATVHPEPDSSVGARP